MTRRLKPEAWSRRDWLCFVGAQTSLLALGGCGGGDAGSASTSSTGSTWSWPEGMVANFDHAAATGLVTPQAVQASSGGVSAASALVGGGSCTLVADDSSPATVMLDHGRVVGGVSTFEVVAFSGAPVLQNRVRHILVKTSDLVSEAEARRRLADLRERIVTGGQDFAAIARQYSPMILTFTGGEPLLRRDLEEVVRAVRLIS